MALGPYSSLGQPVHKERSGNLTDSLKIRTISSSSLYPYLEAETGPREGKALVQAHTTGLEIRLLSP